MRVNADDPKESATSLKNRKRFFNNRGVDMDRVVAAGLRHSAKIMTVGESDRGKIIIETDGLVTVSKGIFLSVTGADCIPLYLFDASGVVGIAHAGWRGIDMGIIPNIISAMIENGAKRETVLIGIGPGIQKCHFEIKDDVLEYFEPYPDALIKRDEKMFVDLPAVIARQLNSLGISPEQIDFSDQCTYCLEQEYFSYRRDRVFNVMAAYIGMKK